MRKKLQQCTAAMLAAMLMLASVPAAASAEDTKKIVVIGDGISTGAGLAEGEKSYVTLVEEYTGAQVQNFAQDSYTTADVLACLEKSEVQAALSEADVILVTVGIHDIMDPFMETADSFMTEFGFAQFADVFTASLSDYGLTENQLLSYNNELIVAAKSNKEAAAANMLEIGEELSAYSNAQVVYQTVYNCIDTIENLDSLSAKRKSAYNSVCNVVSTSLNESVNASLQTIAQTYGCELIDTYTAFKGYAYKYANLSTLDVNPTAEAHAWMAGEVLSAISTLKIGDVNGDNVINASDAADVLVHAADVGAGNAGTLDAGQQAAADVNEDNVVDAADAASILVYAAIAGAGGSPSWD